MDNLKKIRRPDYELIYNSGVDWKLLEGRSVLITGAGGMLGGYLVEFLLYLNNKGVRVNVIGLVRNLSAAEKRFAQFKSPAFILLGGDVSKHIPASPRSIDSIDYVVHAASLASPKVYGVDPVGVIEANTLGTHNLLQLCKTQNSKLIFLSSGEVYGEPVTTGPLTEADFGYLDPMRLRSCYAESKRLGETMCAAWWHQHDVDSRIVRPFHTFGPGVKLADGRIFAEMVGSIRNNEAIDLNSDGSAMRTFCYITDAVSGMLYAMLNGNPGEAYNLGNPRNYISIRELAETLTKVFDLPPVEFNAIGKDQPGYIRSPVKGIRPNIDKLKRLGWEPCVDVVDGFIRTVRYSI